jgi:hypothetical protein
MEHLFVYLPFLVDYFANLMHHRASIDPLIDGFGSTRQSYLANKPQGRLQKPYAPTPKEVRLLSTPLLDDHTNKTPRN